MVYENFGCTIRIPKLDIDDVAIARRAVIDAINGDSFKTMCGNLSVLARQQANGPAPRGGEAEVKCSTDSRGDVRCEGSVKITW
jgi:hypothetical protein